MPLETHKLSSGTLRRDSEEKDCPRHARAYPPKSPGLRRINRRSIERIGKTPVLPGSLPNPAGQWL
jgi:hypothetical protein